MNKHIKALMEETNSLFSEHRKALKSLEDAKAKLSSAKASQADAMNRFKPDSVQSIKAVAAVSQAQNAVKVAQAELSAIENALGDSVEYAMRKARKSLDGEHVAVKASELDVQAVKLLESGMMSTRDYESMLKEYEGNGTMRRFIMTKLKDYENAEGTSRSEAVKAHQMRHATPEAAASKQLQQVAEVATRAARNPGVYQVWDKMAADMQNEG